MAYVIIMSFGIVVNCNLLVIVNCSLDVITILGCGK